jgi:phosphoglycerate dehydrogenase-like enzyme
VDHTPLAAGIDHVLMALLARQIGRDRRLRWGNRQQQSQTEGQTARFQAFHKKTVHGKTLGIISKKSGEKVIGQH